MAGAILDDVNGVRALDPDGMYDRITELPDQILPAWSVADGVDLPDPYRDCRNIVALGMGGSAIGADLVRSLLQGSLTIPMLVNRDYDIPAFVGPESLVIASSYSGTTEETLSAMDQAQRAGARIVALTTGGKVAERAMVSGWPLLRYVYRAQPRAAWAYGFFPLLNVLGRLGYAATSRSDVAALPEWLREIRRSWAVEVASEGNPAKRLALDLYGRLVVVYGAGHLVEVARRWKGQVAENSKGWAFFEVFPELNHNSVVGFPHPESVKPHLLVLMLDAASLHPRVRVRYRVTKELLDQAGVQHRTIDVGGSTPLQQLAGTLLLGDLVSYYLAILNGEDPTPVQVIDHLKRELPKGRTDSGTAS